MPIYGYRCTACGHEFEVWQSMSDARLVQCPECKGPLQKLLYPVGVQFKGSGFYSTDYKKNGSKGDSSEKPAAKAESKSESKSESTAAGGSSSSKPEAKGKGD